MKFYIVDVFAKQKYQGNQLAVFVPNRKLSTAEMQQIARETNFSETSFILSDKQENGGYEVKIFTPDIEADFQVRVFMFVPGFLEDPATGSANGNLAGYLLKYNYFHKSKIQYNVSQGQEINRPSLIRINAKMIDDAFHIRVGGKVHLVAEGNWLE